MNYDLPWNPQRIEQRIGRCHRYGQKHDVVVINFLNERNAADQRVLELLAEKFKLFSGIFGASDEVLHEARPIIFGGDNYSEEWHAEAARRGLLNLPTTLDALDHLCDEKNVALFTRYGVLTETELRSRHEIWVEQYFKKVNIEAETTETIARTMVMPAAAAYLKDLTQALSAATALGLPAAGLQQTAEELGEAIDALRAAIEKLSVQNRDLGGDEVHEKAVHMRDHVIPAMNAVREAGDRLERLVTHDQWPMPTYREILFVK